MYASVECQNNMYNNGGLCPPLYIIILFKEKNTMGFLENVRKEFTLPGEDRYFTLDLNAMIGDRISGNAFDISTRYPYSLSIEEHVKRSISLIDTNAGFEYKCIPVVSGIAYISLDEIKEIKNDPYKFCIENGIIESNEETESDKESKINICEQTATEAKEEMPDIKKFYIRDTFRLLNNDIRYYPLFVKDGCDDRLVVNYDIMEKFMNMKNIKIRVAFCGNKALAYNVYDPEDIYIHVSGTTLTASKYSSKTDKNWRTKISVIEFRSEEWESLNYAHVEILPKEDLK